MLIWDITGHFDELVLAEMTQFLPSLSWNYSYGK